MYALRIILINVFILLNEKFLQFDWLRAVVFRLNLRYLHVKIKHLCGYEYKQIIAWFVRDIWHKYHSWYFKIASNFNFEISVVVFMPSITTNHAITNTYLKFHLEKKVPLTGVISTKKKLKSLSVLYRIECNKISLFFCSKFTIVDVK